MRTSVALFLSLVIFVKTLPLVFANPVNARRDGPPTSNLAQSGYTLPLQSVNNCPDPTKCTVALSSPPADQSLKYLALARGVVLYRCTSPSVDRKPSLEIVDATLWDAAPLLPQIPTEDVFHMLIKQWYEFDYTALKNSSLTCMGAIKSNQQQSTVELFNIAKFGAYREERTQSPDNKDSNLEWTHEVSVDSSWNVYRVETFGGAPPATCEGQSTEVTIDFAAEYWFYH